MRIYVGQIEVEYRFNPYGKYFNLWFYRHNKCIFTATLYKRDMFVDAVQNLGESLRYKGLRTHQAWTCDTHELVIEGGHNQ